MGCSHRVATPSNAAWISTASRYRRITAAAPVLRRAPDAQCQPWLFAAGVGLAAHPVMRFPCAFRAIGARATSSLCPPWRHSAAKVGGIAARSSLGDRRIVRPSWAYRRAVVRVCGFSWFIHPGVVNKAGSGRRQAATGTWFRPFPRAAGVRRLRSRSGRTSSAAA